MKKDRISCKLRSLRNQKPRTRDRFLDRTALLLKMRCLNVDWGIPVTGSRPPDRIFSKAYDIIIIDEEEV